MTNAKQKPAPPGTISSHDLAAACGYSVRYLGDLARAGYFPPARRGRYEIQATIAGLFRHEREQTNQARNDERVERAAYWRTKRIAAEREMQLQEGWTVRVSDVAAMLNSILSEQRYFVLHVIPKNAPYQILALDLTDKREGFHRIREILENYADQFLAYMRESKLYRKLENENAKIQSQQKTETTNCEDLPPPVGEGI